MLGIEDSYTAFCFNEACCELTLRLSEGEEPHYIEQNKKAETKHYNNFKDFYKQYE